MPRGRHPHGTSDAAVMASDRVLAKEAEYRSGIKKIQASALLLAESLALKGDIESSLLQHHRDGDSSNAQKSEVESFLTDQRNRLKALCEGNVKRMRGIDNFIKALGNVRDEVQQRDFQEDQQRRAALDSGGQNDAVNGEEEDLPDYEASILGKIEENKMRQQEEETGIQDEDFSRQIRDRLGEKVNKRRKRRSGADDDDDDEELEIIRNQDAEISLKCPITGQLFEDPVKNNICQHVYSRAGLEHLLKSKKYNCPMPGCNNDKLTLSQVEKDYETEKRVRNHQRKIEQDKVRMSEFDDEELADADTERISGMTVLD